MKDLRATNPTNSISFSNAGNLADPFFQGVLRNIELLGDEPNYRSTPEIKYGIYAPLSQLDLLDNLHYLIVVRRKSYVPPILNEEESTLKPGQVVFDLRFGTSRRARQPACGSNMPNLDANLRSNTIKCCYQPPLKAFVLTWVAA